MGNRLKRVLNGLAGIIDLNDAFTFGGILVMAYGFWLAWPPLGLIVAGLMLFIIGYRR